MRNDRLFATLASQIESGVWSKVRCKAFARLELIAISATFCMLVLLMLPSLASTSMRSNQASCLNNLRQIGIAFQAWGNDHSDNRPWFVFTNEGGTHSHPARGNAYIHYSVLSNHLSPTLLIDPAETNPAKRMATTWNLSPGGFLSLKNSALSYMFSIHTWIPDATDILSSDRNVQFAGATVCSSGGGTPVQELGTGVSRSEFRGWTNGPHGIAGNVLINDGRVEYAGQTGLKAIIVPQRDPPAGDHLVTPF